MYTWEIKQFIENHGLNISRSDYFDIIKTSPQIENIKWLGGQTFRLIAEGLNIKFNVHA